MKVKATVFYWPSWNMGLGHIAIEIYDADTDKPIAQVNWAMGYSLEQDRLYYKSHPHEQNKNTCYLIDLPIAPVDGTIFLEKFKTLPYSVDAKLEAYGAEYALMNYNCAHAVNNVLRMLEYRSDKKLISEDDKFKPTDPSNKLGLLPSVVAKRTAKGALQQLKIAWEAIKNSDEDAKDKIPRMLSLTLRQLEMKAKLQQLSPVITDKEMMDDLKLLSPIVKDLHAEFIQSKGFLLEALHDQTLDYDPYSKAKILFKLAREIKDQRIYQELRACINLFDPKVQYYAQIELALAEMKATWDADNLIQRGHPMLAIRIKDCIQQIEFATADLKAEELSPKEFKEKVMPLINEILPDAEKHRGLARILKNVLIAVAGLGVGYIIAGLVNKYKTGNFLFFNETKTGSHLKKITTALEATPDTKPDQHPQR